MKHTLKAKYASDGIRAHRQRVEATQPAAVVARRRRQAVVDAVSARFAESARPKVDANDVFNQATMTSIRREAVVAQVTARLAAPRPSDFGTFSGAQSAAWSAHLARQLARNPGFFVKFGFDESGGDDFGVITTHTVP